MTPLFKNTYREILRSPGRFLAILAIIVLGSGFFVGLRVSEKAMTATAADYYSDAAFYDFSLANTLGFTDENVAAIAADPNVMAAEGAFETDALVTVGGGVDLVYKFHSMPSAVNTPVLVSGRMPQSPGECLADSWSGIKVGDTVTLSPANSDDTLELFRTRSFTVTGVATSPLYLNFERGSTDLGSGSVSAFCYIPPEALDADYYTAVYVRCHDMPRAYSAAYDDRADLLEPDMTALSEAVARSRYDSVISDAQSEIDDAEREYSDALQDYLTQREDAERELDEAKAELDDAKAELDDAKRQIDDGWLEYNDSVDEFNSGRLRGQEELDSARRELEAAKAALDAAANEYDSGMAQYEEGERQYSEGAAQLEQLRAAYELAKADPSTPPTVLSGLEAQLDSASATLAASRQELDSAKAGLDAAKATIDSGRLEYEENLEKYNAAVDEYNASMADAQAQLDDAYADLLDAEADYADGLREYEDGLQEYQDSRAQADSEFAEAEEELEDARRKIDDAKLKLEDIEEPDSFALGRWSNLGYSCFESDTSIVKAISAVFPVFFFLVAALICLTTVSRMVEEQRSQLGVLLALGYSRPAVMGKFLVYSGTATVLGAASGILLGSKLIPMVVWKAYNIMYVFSDSIKFVFDLPLSAITFSLYVISMLAVTLITCGRELRDVPANLIRPKPPRSGKRVLLERVRFVWDHLSFLWKVTVRNIFRYKSRVLMMILGIAGCTALMMTGMGINDSIRNVVDYQFTEISLYDYSVTFSDGLSPEDMTGFVSAVSEYAGRTVFFNQESMTASAGREEKEVQLNVLPEESLAAIPEFVDFHTGRAPIPLPSDGQILINSGLSESLDLSVGDSLTLRNDDGESMDLTVSGVYDNYIYNSVYVTGATYTSALGREPDINFALVIKAPQADSGQGLAAILSQPNVLTSTSSVDLRARIGGMMDSLIYIVLLTIVCAAALAFVVIYNLTNINIQERLREIATVKVLGFYDPETALYVLRENILLTLLGAAAGIPLGLALNAYVVTRIELDMIHFTPRVLPATYLWSVALTILFSLIVDLLMLRRLSHIDPASALKSAE